MTLETEPPMHPATNPAPAPTPPGATGFAALEHSTAALLRALPACTAPPSLMPRVLRAVAARDRAPWWTRHFRAWPLHGQVAFCFGAACLAVLTGLGWQHLIGPGDAAMLAASPGAFASSHIALSLGAAIVDLLRSAALAATSLWLGVTGIVAVLLYGVLLGAGLLGYHTLLRPRTSRAGGST